MKWKILSRKKKATKGNLIFHVSPPVMVQRALVLLRQRCTNIMIKSLKWGAESSREDYSRGYPWEDGIFSCITARNGGEGRWCSGRPFITREWSCSDIEFWPQKDFFPNYAGEQTINHAQGAGRRPFIRIWLAPDWPGILMMGPRPLISRGAGVAGTRRLLDDSQRAPVITLSLSLSLFTSPFFSFSAATCPFPSSFSSFTSHTCIQYQALVSCGSLTSLYLSHLLSLTCHMSIPSPSFPFSSLTCI